MHRIAGDHSGSFSAAVEAALDQIEDAVARQRAHLIADVGLEHLRTVGVDGVAHTVLVEGVEDPGELIPAGDHARVEVAGGTQLQRDPALADYSQFSIVAEGTTGAS